MHGQACPVMSLHLPVSWSPLVSHLYHLLLHYDYQSFSSHSLVTPTAHYRLPVNTTALPLHLFKSVQVQTVLH